MGTVDEFYRRLRTEVETIISDFEIVFVNDGSTDQSLDVALDFQKEDVRIRVSPYFRPPSFHRQYQLLRHD